MRFKNKTVLITGGSTGIGFAVAKQIIDEGGQTIITGRHQASLDEATSKLGSKAHAVVSDAGSLKDIDNLFSFIQKEIGKIDGVFANAGIAFFMPIEEVTEELYDKLMDINVKGVYFTLQKSLTHLNDNGAIVITSSIAGVKGRGTGSVYAASKAAVRSMARTFASALLERNIRVNAVSPGPIETPIWDKGDSKNLISRTKEEIRNANPMQRFGSPEEVSTVVTFLLSNEASFITGSEVFVDGGMTQL